MTINIISDIHCIGSYLPPHLNLDDLQKTDVLVIAGDIGTYEYRNDILKYIKDKYQGDKFNDLIYVWGNHDYYVSSDIYQPKGYQKPSINDNHIELIDNVAFICTPLWTKIFRPFHIIRCINDYACIPDFDPNQSTILFKQNAEWLLDSVSKYKKEGYKIVVVTHHGPHSKLIDDEYKNNSLNEAFFCLDSKYFNRFADCGADLWIHGHSHNFNDTTIGKTRFIRNPFGYDYRRNREYVITGFKLNTIIEI